MFNTPITAQKNEVFHLRISSVNVAKSAEILEEIFNEKLHFWCSDYFACTKKLEGIWYSETAHPVYHALFYQKLRLETFLIRIKAILI